MKSCGLLTVEHEAHLEDLKHALKDDLTTTEAHLIYMLNVLQIAYKTFLTNRYPVNVILRSSNRWRQSKASLQAVQA